MAPYPRNSYFKSIIYLNGKESGIPSGDLWLEKHLWHVSFQLEGFWRPLSQLSYWISEEIEIQERQDLLETLETLYLELEPTSELSSSEPSLVSFSSSLTQTDQSSLTS